MAGARDQAEHTIMSAQAADGHGTSVDGREYRHKIADLIGAGGATMSVRCQVSRSQNAPDFSAAAAEDNEWTYCSLVDLSDTDSGAVAGSTGIAFSGNGITKVLLNEEGITHFNFEVYNYSAGTMTVKSTMTKDA